MMYLQLNGNLNISDFGDIGDGLFTSSRHKSIVKMSMYVIFDSLLIPSLHKHDYYQISIYAILGT